MVGVGLIVLLVGLFYVVPRGGVSGSAAIRNLGFGMQGMHQTPGDSPQNLGKRQWVKSVLGALAIVVGGLIIHFATN